MIAKLIKWIYTGSKKKNSSLRLSFLDRGYAVLLMSIFVIYIIVFGIDKIIDYVMYELYEIPMEEDLKFFVSSPDLISFTILLIFIILGFKIKSRSFLGVTSIIIVHFIYIFFSNAAKYILERKSYFKTISLVLLTISVLIFCLFFVTNSYKKDIEIEHDRIRNDIFRFIERSAISPRSSEDVRRIILEYDKLISSELYSHLINIDICEKNLVDTLRDIYISCGDIGNPNSATEFFDNLRSLEEKISRACNDGCINCAYRCALKAKLNIVFAEQGYNLPFTVDAHRLLLEVDQMFSTEQHVTSIVYNGLGNVYAYYLQNYDKLKAGYRWLRINEIPIPRRSPDDDFLSTIEIINASFSNYKKALNIESNSDANFAEKRHHNNIADLCYRILLLREHKNVNLYDNKKRITSITKYFQEHVKNIDSPQKSVNWIREKRAFLSKNLAGSDILETLITVAQLGCLEREISEENGVPLDSKEATLSPYDSIVVALVMGFRNKSFFELQEYMGMKKLLECTESGEKYREFVKNYIDITPECEE